MFCTNSHYPKSYIIKRVIPTTFNYINLHAFIASWRKTISFRLRMVSRGRCKNHLYQGTHVPLRFIDHQTTFKSCLRDGRMIGLIENLCSMHDVSCMMADRAILNALCSR